jgi:hypothetical protein
MKLKEATKTHTQKDRTVWEWKETDATIEALNYYYKVQEETRLKSGVPVRRPSTTP